jgi:hypothetical protein
VSRIGLLFPGEMGTQIGVAAHGDVLWASEGRSETTAQRAGAARFRDVRTLAELVAKSEVVISLCPPAIAEEGRIHRSSAGGDPHGRPRRAPRLR